MLIEVELAMGESFIIVEAVVFPLRCSDPEAELIPLVESVRQVDPCFGGVFSSDSTLLSPPKGLTTWETELTPLNSKSSTPSGVAMGATLVPRDSDVLPSSACNIMRSKRSFYEIQVIMASLLTCLGEEVSPPPEEVSPPVSRLAEFLKSNNLLPLRRRRRTDPSGSLVDDDELLPRLKLRNMSLRRLRLDKLEGLRQK